MQPNQSQQPPQTPPQPAPSPQPPVASQGPAPSAQQPASVQPVPTSEPQYSQQASVRSSFGRRPDFHHANAGVRPDNDLASLVSAPSPQPQPKRRKGLLILSAIAALIIVGIAVYFIFDSSQRDDSSKVNLSEVTVANVVFKVPDGWQRIEKNDDAMEAYAYHNGEDEKTASGFVYVGVSKKAIYTTDALKDMDTLKENIRKVYEAAKEGTELRKTEEYGGCTQFYMKDIELQDAPKDKSELKGVLQYRSACDTTKYTFYGVNYALEDGRTVVVFASLKDDSGALSESMRSDLFAAPEVKKEQ